MDALFLLVTNFLAMFQQILDNLSMWITQFFGG